MPSHWKRLRERLGRLFARRLDAPSEEPPRERGLQLADGTPVLIRPIEPGDGAALAEALERLSPASRYQRFLSVVKQFTPAQLEYLTHQDGVNHIALGMAVTHPDGSTPTPIAVARCIREEAGSDLAEAAIVVADEWHGRGVGTLLLQCLSARAWEAGIRRWKALMLAENAAALHLFDKVATRRSQHPEGIGVVELLYDLRPEEREP